MPGMAGFGGESYQTPYGNFGNFQDLLDHLGRTHQPRGTPPASKNFVERLPIVTIGEQDIKDNAECSVCKDTFSLDDKALKLPCIHLFHSGNSKPIQN
jgi:E3 ubiquitin-protein ligase RNF115/126